METKDIGSITTDECNGAKIQPYIIAIKRAAPNGGIQCPKCDGELVLTVDRRTNMPIHECTNPECQYFED